ncbi:MAG TPA: phospholipase D family protein [Saprospiraceae bacterium]|nr:phospholipase D family protein [Saprospiraceae bacterium]HMQ85604.1 phospholipase D family protein [Saprospiraceae bacterium]
MAKFLNTTGVSYHLEELIKSTKDRLILISPYLQFHNRIRDHIQNLNIQKRDIRIVYRESKLQLEESNWLESQIGVRTSICPTLHAKCYLNENEAIVTSMNLYSFSQQNNDEMGIHVTKEKDPELYHDIYEEAQRLLTISEEIRVSVKKIDKKKSEQIINEKAVLIEKEKDYSKSNYKTTKELSEITGLSSRQINSWLVNNKLMYKEGDDWISTKKGYDWGAVSKTGQYGKFIVWPEEIVYEIKK